MHEVKREKVKVTHDLPKAFGKLIPGEVFLYKNKRYFKVSDERVFPEKHIAITVEGAVRTIEIDDNELVLPELELEEVSESEVKK